MGTEGLKIDLGCGTAKCDGFVGLDLVDAPGVDHVLDLTAAPFPFPDASVGHVFSAHFLEHIPIPNHLFSEIGRVCKEGAKIEFWTPYGFSNEAFLYGHEAFLTEEIWFHFCVRHRDHHLGILKGRWLLNSINFVVLLHVQRELAAQRIPLPFAIKHLNNVVHEFGVDIDFSRNLDVPPSEPSLVIRTERFGKSVPLS
jgi:SAM-dependent methyltransferase